MGRRLADKLVQVWRRDGAEAWVLIHIEVQGQEEAAFPQRMFVYHYRLFDRYNRPVVSLAVLGDDRATWRPNQFTLGLWGCETRFTFPVVKLLDYRSRRAELEASRNPFATVVLAHLTRRLYDLGYTRTDIINLFYFIDWLLRLPDKLEQQFWQEMEQWEEVRRMRYVTSVERIGIQKGLEQGLEQGLQQGRTEGQTAGLRQGLLAGIELGLELKFGTDGLRLLPEIQQIPDLAVIEAVHAAIKDAQTLDELRQVYTGAGDTPPAS